MSSPARQSLPVTRYRYLDAMGDVLVEQEHADRADALAWAGQDEDGADAQRVEYLGPEGDWRWAGPLLD